MNRRRTTFFSMTILFETGFFLIFLGQVLLAQGVGISSTAITPDTNSILELRSTVKGFLAPRMTTAQRTALGSQSPSAGMLVYDTNTRSFWYWDNNVWNGIAAGSGVGTVTSFSAGALSPLFTTSVATATTTPALSFAISNAGAYTLLGNNSASSAAPAYFAPALASGLFANQGTGTTILHGNASGNPSWGSVALGTDVSGTLPIAKGGTNSSAALNNNRIMVSSGGAIAEANALTNGQLLIGFAGAAPMAANLTAGSGISITNGAGAITIAATGGNGTVTSFSAGALSPLFTTSVATATTTPALSFAISNAGAYTLLGNNSASSAVPAYFAPALASGLFANQGTGTTILHGNASGNPSWGSVALGTDVSGTLPIANGGTNSSAALNNNRIMVSSGGAIAEANALTNGQLLIGSAGTAPMAANLTAGSGISITNGAGAITIAATGGNGTVTSFSAGALSPLFTTSVATATTTPALSFAISNAGAYTSLATTALQVLFPRTSLRLSHRAYSQTREREQRYCMETPPETRRGGPSPLVRMYRAPCR